MGNEASLEGGEGALTGLPAGLAPDGKGGFIQMPAGVEADLSNLSEEERKQLVAAMAKSQSRPPETQAGGTRVSAGLSKSRTVDAFGEGPPPKPKPGRSPSSLSLLESRFRQEPKDPEQSRTGMFSSGFLSGANPLSAVSSAVSSASIPKFSLFGDDEEEQPAKQEGKPPGPQSGAGKGPPQQGGKPPQQGPPKGQGPSQQRQGPESKPGPQPQGPQQGPRPGGPGPQQQGPKPGGAGPQQQGPKPGGHGPQQQGPKPGGQGPQQQGPKPGGQGPQQQGPKPGGPGAQQQGAKPGGTGPPQQGPKPGGPGPQQQGPKPGGPGPQQQGPKPGGPGPQQQGPVKPGPGVAGKPSGPQQQGKPGPGAQSEGSLKTGPAQGKAMCPLCKSTELNVKAKDQPPNYNTCTQCKQQVCSLCGFSPPDSAGKEWLCLNCQMQRAVGGMEPPGPPMMKQPPKQGSATPSPQRIEPPSGSPSKDEPGKKPPMLTKQQSIADTGKGSTPPATPKPGPHQGPHPDQLGAKRGLPPPLQKPSQSPKGSPQPSPAKTTPKQDGGGFFGGFGLGGLTEVTKPSAGTQATESVTGKLFSGFGGSSKPQAGSAAQASESVTGKLFSGFSGLTDSAKPPAATPQAAESVSGKMFGFGSSFLSSATNLISGEESKSPPESPLGSPPDSPIGSDVDSPPGSLPDSGSDSPPDTPPAYSKDPLSPKPTAEGKASADTSPPKSKEVGEPPVQDSGSITQSCCPLCKVKLNVGSGESPNYSMCTECQKTVCNLCGFNPTPHLSEKEWLCLNCQTQRALSGQLGDMPPPPSPSKLPAKHEPTPPSSPARAVSSTPSSPAPTATPAKGLTRMPSITQALDDKSEPVSAKVDAKDVKNTETEQGVTAEPIPKSTQKKEEAAVSIKDNELLKEPSEKDRESSPTSPSDLAKLESTVLPILEAQTSSKEESQTETPKVKRRLEVLPMSPVSPSSEDDQHEETKEKSNNAPKKERKKLLVPTDIQGDSFEESSEGEPSPKLQSKNTFEDKEVEMESPMDEEDFIRKQIIEMSADEDASPSDEENLAKRKIKDQEKKQMEQNAQKDVKDKSESGKARRLLKKSSISPEDELEQKSIISVTKIEELAKGEQPSVDSGAGIRHFKTIELNSTATVRQTSDDGELESLTDSPDDRSRGEGSSSLHASSFTPGTSPTSLSSLDEDSDSSSPSHVRSSGEGKQQRKAKHRQPGQTLPTIEDSSEEEELREEEELLREQEKQKGTGKKSKKDKEEIRAQRRRERPKTPPSNLSPIEDASPTEELRQEAEMEEIRRSSCSDLSPSMESEPESFEILPEKIVAVQKVYQLPTSVSLYSPTDEQHVDNQFKERGKHSLKSADEVYEEIMLKAKSPTNEENKPPPGKESLYGGMLIEDYAYESLVDDASCEKEPDKLFVSEKPKKKLRSPDEVYEDMMQRKKEIMLKEQEQTHNKPEDVSKPETVLPDTDSSKDTMSSSNTGQSRKDGKPLLDAEAAYEELLKKQRAVLTPGTSPTQAGPDLTGMAQGSTVAQVEKTETAPLRRILPIPDLRVTQCSSGEEESGEESISDQTQDSEKVTVSATKTEPQPLVDEAFQKTSVSETVVDDLSLQREVALPAISSDSLDATEKDVEIEQTGVVDLSKPSVPTQIDSVTAPVPSVISRQSAPVIVSVSPLSTVPQYIVSTIPGVVSTAPPVPPKPIVLRRAASLEKADIPVPPPLPPPTLPKPSVYPKKTPPQVPPRTTPVGMPTTGDSVPVRQPLAPAYKPHVPPPVPPKPSSIPAGLTFSHKPGETIKPPIAPKPIAGVQPPFTGHTPSRPTILSTSSADSVLNLSPSAESRMGTTSPLKSPTSPRFGKVLRDTYVVITLPSQPGSPTESITTQASISPSQESPQKLPPTPPQPPPQSQTTRVPLAFTRITESIESQEICGPEKVVSSMSHVYEAISASTQPQSITPNVGVQVVTTEVQRTTVSVVHERTPPPHPILRATGISVVQENTKPEPVQAQNGHAYHPGEIVDLRTPKIDVETSMKGVDLSSSESRRQSLAIDGGGRQQSAVQPSVVNLSTDASLVSLVTDNITILTCTATVAYGSDASLSKSMPLQLTTAKSFEPVTQIIYRPVDYQPEKPINLSTTMGKTHSVPVTIAPTIANNSIGATLPPRLETGLSGAVDLTTVKPAQTMVAMNGSTAEVVTAVITEEDGKPVDLTAGRRAVCCDVVYKLPFASSCTTQQPSAPLPEDRFGYRDDHYQYDRTPYGMRGLGGIKPSMSDTNLAEAGLFLYKSKHSFDYKEAIEGAVDLTSGKMLLTGEAVDYSSKSTGVCTGMTVPQYTQARITSAVGTHYGISSVLRSSNGIVYSSVAAPVPSTYAITTQPGSIFSTSYNSLSGMHTSDTMPSLSTLQNQPLTRSHSFLSTVAVTTAEEQSNLPLNLEIGVSMAGLSTTLSDVVSTVTTVASLDTYTNASLEAIAASLEALSSPVVPGDGQYQMERELLELEKMKQQRLAEELEWERHEIQRFREQEQLLVQKELEELQVMKQQILCQQEEERQAHLMMQKETYAQQQEQLEQIQRLQEQLRQQLEEQKFRQMYPSEVLPEALVVVGERKMDSGCQTDEEDNTEKAYTAGRKKKSTKKSVDSCVQTDDEDQDDWEVPTRGRRSRPRGGKNGIGERGAVSVQALTEISVQTDSSGTLRGHSVQVDARVDYPDSDRTSSPKRRPTPLDISQSPHLKADASTLQVLPGPPKSPKVLYSPISPCVSPSKSLEYLSYEKSLGDTSPQRIRSATDLSKGPPTSPRAPKVIQRSMSDPKPLSPTAEERAAANFQFSEGYSAKGSPSGTPSGTQKKVKRTLPNPPSEEEAVNAGQTAYTSGSARRRLCRSTNMARAKILQDIDRELDLVERESSKLRKKQAELDEEEKEIDAKLRYLEMGINRRKDALLKEREKRERAYLQSVAEDRDYMSDSEVSNIRETRSGEEASGHGLERPRTAPQAELDEFVPPQTKHDQYGKYSQYQYPQYQQSLYQPQSPYQSQSIYSSVPSLTASQQQSYHQMLLLQQKARQQAALLSELDSTKIATNYDTSSYLGGKYGNHLDMHSLEERADSMAVSPMSNVSADSFYADLDPHQTPRSYMLLEDAAELAKGTGSLSSTSYGIAERELAKAERLLRHAAADVGTDYLGSSSRLHSYGKAQDEEDPMEEPFELKLLKQQLKQEFRRSTGGTDSLEQLAGLSHHYTPSTGVSSGGYRAYPKTEKYSISRLTLEKQAAKQLPTSVLYQKHKNTSNIGKYSSIQDCRGLETDYSSYLGSSSSSPRSSRLLQDEITFGLRKNIAEQQKYLGSTLGANLAGSLNLGQSLNLSPGMRSSLGEDSAYPSGSRSRPSSRPSSVYGLDLSIKRDISSSSLRLKAEGDPSSETSAFQTPSGRTKPTSLPIVQGGRGRIPIVAQNSEEESPLSPVGQPMGMARASAGPLPPISADSRDQFGSCMSLQDPQQQHLREDTSRGRGYVLMDDLQGTMSDSEALSESLVGLCRDDPGNSHENVTNAYHLRREETDWFDKPRDGRTENGQGVDRRQGKSAHYPFPHTRIKLQRDPKDRSVSGNGLGIRVVGGKEVPGSNGDIGAYVAKVLPGGAAEQTGKIVEGMQVLEWNSVCLTGKTYEEVQGLVGHQVGEAELCIRLDLNMLSDSESSHLDLQDQNKGDRPPRSPGVDPKQLAAELQKVSQQQLPSSSASTLDKASASAGSSAVPSPGQPGSPSVSKKRHSKTSEAAKTQSHPVSGEIQLQINYDKQLGNLIVHVLQARNLAPRDNNGYSDPFVKVYLLPGRGQVMVVQNASAENKRRSKHVQKTLNPEWNQTVIYKNIHLEQLRKKTLEVSVWDYDKSSANDFLGEVLIDLSNTAQLDNVPRWLPLKEQSEGEHHRRSHSGQGRQHSPKPHGGHGTQHSPKTSGHSKEDSPKSSVIKSRSHGIFPDPAKGRTASRMPLPPLLSFPVVMSSSFPFFYCCHFYTFCLLFFSLYCSCFHMIFPSCISRAS
ncbi:unnamed protein product [Leuciscus chuanchicus]